MNGDDNGVGRVLADLVEALPPQHPLSREAVRVYRENLGDVPPGLLQAAARRCIRTCRWFPKIAELREAAAEISLDLPSEGQALQQVFDRVEHTRRFFSVLDDPDGGDAPPPPRVHPLVLRVLDLVGGYAAFRSGEGSVVRGQFGRIYRDERATAVRERAAADFGILKP
jgi:hypothetical protein